MKIQKDLKEGILAQTVSSELFSSIKLNSLEVQREYKKNFTRRDVEMLYIDAASIVQASEIAASDLEKYFTDNKTNFVQADISWIVLESGGVADNLYKTLKDDITLFEKSALEKSVDTNNYKLGYRTRMEMPSDDFANKIFADNKGNSLLEPIYVNGLYYIVLVNDIRVPDKYTDINQDILKREYFNVNMTSLLEAEKTKQAEVLKSAAAGVNNLRTLDGNGYIKYYKSSAPFSYNQGRLNTEEGTIIPDSSTEAFYNNAFTLQLDAVSDVIKLDNGVAVMRVISEEKPDVSRLATLDAATRNVMKKELSRQRVNDIVLEWGNQNISKARVKRHNIR